MVRFVTCHAYVEVDGVIVICVCGGGTGNLELLLSNGTTVTVHHSLLPFVVATELPRLMFVPHNDTKSLVDMCSATDTFEVMVVNPDKSWNASSPVTTISLHLDCEVHVCPSGSHLVAVSTGSVRCLRSGRCFDVTHLRDVAFRCTGRRAWFVKEASTTWM
jgi:hypothetical protein